MKILNLRPIKGMCPYVSFKIHPRADSSFFMEKHEEKINITKYAMCSNLFAQSSNNVQISGIFYETVRHMRAEAGCETSEIHYGLREVQHQGDHSRLEWWRSEDSGGGCANGKGKRMVFSSKVQREMSISVIPTKIITYKTEGQRVFSRESMRTPMKLGFRVFQLTTREAFSSAQNITWLGRGEAGVHKSGTSYIFAKSGGLEQRI